MRKYKKRILEILGTLPDTDCRERGKRSEPKNRSPNEYIPFLMSGVATAAVAMSKYGTKEMVRVKNAAIALKGTGPVTGNEEVIERLIDVQDTLRKDRRATNFRRQKDWTVSRSSWGDIFVGEGLTALDQLVRSTPITITADGQEPQEGVVHYLPWDSLLIGGAARIICEQLLRETSDPVFDTRLRDR